MVRFYLLLWLFWLIRVVLCTLFTASILSLLVTFFIYVKQGFVTIDAVAFDALFDIWQFWFLISLNLALLFALFRSVKYLFNRCYSGFMLQLQGCDIVGYGDLIKVWRKWFMLLIWLVGSLMVLALIATHLFTSYDSLFDWFGIYLLYLFIAMAGYISFILIVARCKSIKVVKC